MQTSIQYRKGDVIKKKKKKPNLSTWEREAGGSPASSRATWAIALERPLKKTHTQKKEIVRILKH